MGTPDKTDEKYAYFSDDAQATLATQVGEYEEYLIQEARLIEQGEREKQAKKEITSSHVLQAVQRSKVSRPKNRGAWPLILKLASAITGVAVGALFNLDRFQLYPLEFFMFLIALIIFIASTALSLALERGER